MTPADQAVTQSITNSLMTAGGVSAQTLTNIHVRTMNGRVILTGQVNTQTEKQNIETQVRQTPGVRMVINQLRVGATGVGGPGASGASTGAGTGASDTSTGSTTPGSPSTGGTGTGTPGSTGTGGSTGTPPR